MARDRGRNATTAHVLYDFFVFRKRAPAMIVAERLRVAYSTLAAWWENRESVPVCVLRDLPGALRGLVSAEEIAELVSNLIGAGDAGLTVSSDPAADEPDAVRSQALAAGAAVGAVQNLTLEALDDDNIDDREAKAIARQIEKAERTLETLKKATRGRRR